MSKSVTSVTSSNPFLDNPYTRARALRLMQEDVTDVTNVTSRSAPRRIPRPALYRQLSPAMSELGPSQPGEQNLRGER
jgi:hypothetical protein